MGHYADEICVMGTGNARTVALAPVTFELSYDGTSHNLTITKGKFAYSRSVLCPVDVVDGNGYGERAYLQYAQNGGAGGQTGRPGTSISSQHP